MSEPQDYRLTVSYHLSRLKANEDAVRTCERALQAARNRVLRNAREVDRVLKLAESDNWPDGQFNAVFGDRLDEAEHAAFVVWQAGDR